MTRSRSQRRDRSGRDRRRMARSLGSRPRRERGGEKRWWIVIAVCVLVVGLLVWLNAFVIEHVEVDEITGCPSNGRMPEAHTIILVDETDALNPDTIEYAKNVIYNEYRWLPIGGRMTVRNVISNPDLAEDIVFCRIEDGSNANGIIDNPRMIQQRFDEIAGERLQQLYEALSVAPEQEQSPIAEFVSIAMDRTNFGRNVADRRLILLSDMAQHSDIASQYGAAPLLDPDAPALDHLEREMAGVHLRIHYLRRPELARLQTDAHRAFWTGYFANMGADDIALGRGLLLGEPDNRETWSYDRE